MLDGRVSGGEEWDVKVVVNVKDGELMMVGKWFCKWEEGSEGRRWRGEVSYSPPGQTSHVSTPAQLSRSLLWLSILSIGSRTCMLMECHDGIRSFQSHILLRLLLNQAAELGSSGHGPHFLGKA